MRYLGGDNTAKTPPSVQSSGPMRLNEAAFRYYARLARVKQHVEGSREYLVSLAEAADVACLERKYFSTFFHAKVGITFTAWQRSLRIEKAIAILKSNDESLRRVASLTGFRSFRTFERAFKRCTGFTPIQFKLRTRP